MDTFLSLAFRSVLKTLRGIVPESLLLSVKDVPILVMFDSRPLLEKCSTPPQRRGGRRKTGVTLHSIMDYRERP
jgi:hypothetical protein